MLLQIAIGLCECRTALRCLSTLLSLSNPVLLDGRRQVLSFWSFEQIGMFVLNSLGEIGFQLGRVQRSRLRQSMP